VACFEKGFFRRLSLFVRGLLLLTARSGCLLRSDSLVGLLEAALWNQFACVRANTAPPCLSLVADLLLHIGIRGHVSLSIGCCHVEPVASVLQVPDLVCRHENVCYVNLKQPLVIVNFWSLRCINRELLKFLQCQRSSIQSLCRSLPSQNRYAICGSASTSKALRTLAPTTGRDSDCHRQRQ